MLRLSRSINADAVYVLLALMRLFPPMKQVLHVFSVRAADPAVCWLTSACRVSQTHLKEENCMTTGQYGT